MTPILILRGWGSKIENWQKFISLLEERNCRVYSPDLPGFGNNPPPQKMWSIDDYADWVKDFCEKQNISRFFLLGHSFGGGVAVKHFLKYPGRIERLMLVDPAIVRKRTKQKEVFKKTANAFKKLSFLPFFYGIRKAVYGLILRKSDYPFAEGIMKDIYLKAISEDLTDCLPKINIPVLIVWGEKDDLTPIGDAYLIRGKIPRSELKIIPGIFHNPHSECPGELADIIIDFLRQS